MSGYRALDCLIVGGGPAGLTAAVYLARFHLNVKIIDAGDGRAASIPCTHNHAGFPGGISGRALIGRMAAQAQDYGALLATGRVTILRQIENGFEAEWGEGPAVARSVLLATGVRNRRPSMDEGLHERALAAGLIRYCPVCDGYEVTDKDIAVVGTAEKGVNEATFLRSFTRQITLIAPDGRHILSDGQRASMREIGVQTVDGPAAVLRIDDGKLVIMTAQGERVFDSAYPALGSDINSSLAGMLGAACSDTGCLLVDSHQRTSIDGVYAAGDVVVGLDQISHAMGQGGVAATTIRNDLGRTSTLLR